MRFGARFLFLLLLLLTSFASAQTTLSGGSSYSGGFTIAPLDTPPPPVGSCTPGSITGRTLLNACGSYGSGSYYMNSDLSSTGTCLSITGANFDLEMQCKKITYASDPTTAQQTFLNQTGVAVSTTNQQYLPRPGTSTTDGTMATVIAISNTITCNGVTYTKDVNYGLAYDHPHGKYGGTSANNRGFIWLSGKPASGTCTIPSYTVSYPRFGIFNSNANQYVRNTGNTTGGGSNLKVRNGFIEPSASTTPTPYSAGIFIGEQTAPLIEGMNIKSKGWSAPAVMFSYVSGGAIKSSTLECVANSGNVFWRDVYEGYCFRNVNQQTAGGGLGTIFQNSQIIDSMQGGVTVAQNASVLSGNTIGPMHQRFTNGFALMASASDIYDNNINLFDPNDDTVGGRGIYCQWGSHCYNNIVTVHGSDDNIEYSGCEAGGGPYAMQSESTHSAHSDNNKLLAVARNCDGMARRFTNFGTSTTSRATGYFENEEYRAFRFASTSAGDARGIHFLTVYEDTSNAIGGLGRNTLVEADTYNIFVEAATEATLTNMTLTKGTTTAKYICGDPANAGVGVCSHPSSNYATFRMEGYGGTTTLNMIDPTFLNGASATSVSGVIDNSFYSPYHIWIKWSRTFTLTEGGNPVVNATVTLTDVAGGTYSGQTNASGQVTIVVPQYHHFNTASVAVNTSSLNPYSLSITKTGCTTVTASGLNYTAAGSTAYTTSCSISSLSTETGNNTSASSSFTASGWTNGVAPASNVSKESIKEYLYSGFNGKVLAHIVAWWGTGSHQDIGYTSNTTTQSNLMVTDMKSRQIDGVIHDWYGSGTNSENVAQKVVSAAVAAGSFLYATMIDVNAFSCATSVECANDLIDHLTYLNSAGRFSSSAYYKVSGRPMVFFFSMPSAGIDWTTVNANSTVQAINPYFILENEGAFTNANAHGGFSWVTDTFSDPDGWGQTYLQSFYTKAKQNPSKFAFGSTKPGFDDTEASWGQNRILQQDCGDTWLQTWNLINTNYSSTTQLSGTQLVTWDDYEEGSEIETGIDSCIAVSATVNSSAVSWTIPSGNTSAIHHFKLFYSTDGGITLQPLVDNLGAALRTYSITGLGFTAGTKFYVKMIGKSSFINVMSNAATL
jgi:hypothetical protein